MSPRITIADLEIQRQKDPFVVVLNDPDTGEDREYTFPDPQTQSFEFLMDFGSRSPAETVEAILGPDTYAAFLKNPEVTGYVMTEIMSQYAKHFGIRLPPQTKP